MGNATCGTQSDGMRFCCNVGNPAGEDIVNGASQPQQPSTEIQVGNMDAAAPGLGTQELRNIGRQDNVQDAAPGADSAAGGDNQHLSYDDGSTYTGQVQNGRRHGQGTWDAKTGKYEGQWQDDQQHGTGHQTWDDGRVYDGQFGCGKFSGRGKMVWHTQKGQLTYDGEYKDDLKHGIGQFNWTDGRVYNGAWVEGKRHGRGLYINARGDRRNGYWADDKFVRWDVEANGSLDRFTSSKESAAS